MPWKGNAEADTETAGFGLLGYTVMHDQFARGGCTEPTDGQSKLGQLDDEPGRGSPVIDLARVALPDVEPRVDPARWLTPEQWSAAVRVSDAALAHEARHGPDQRHGRLHVRNAADKVKLYERLLAAGMVTLADAQDGDFGEAGAFGVDKPGHADRPRAEQEQRFVLNAVSGNAPQRPVPSVLDLQLINPATLARVRIPDDSEVHVDSSDISGMFHALIAPPAFGRLYALPAIPWRQMGIDRDGDCRPMPTSLIMGATLSPFLAHETAAAILRAEFAGDDNVLVVTRPADLPPAHVLRPDQVIVFLYLDDAHAMALDPVLANEAGDRARAAFRAAGFTIRADKDERAGERGDAARVLGVEFTVDGTLRPHRVKARQLQADLRLCASTGLASGRQLASLTGRTVWTLLLRRGLLSHVSALYAQTTAAGGPLDRRLTRLWATTVIEMRNLADLLDGVTLSLTTRLSTRVLASDACLSGYGGAELVRPAPTLLLRRVLAQDQMADAGVLLPPDGDARGAVPPWRTTFSIRASPHLQAAGDILLLELVALLLAVRRAIQHQAVRQVDLVALVDNQGAVGIVNKGRAKRGKHRRIVRQLDDLCHTAGVVLHVRYVSTTLNVADEPSRRFERVSPLIFKSPAGRQSAQ